MMTASPPAASPAAGSDGAPPSTVYFGSVFPLKGAAAGPAFVYERTVAERDGALVSTHVTRDPSGAIALHESATHLADYRLVEYTLHANQLRQTGTIRVARDRVSFERFDGTRRRTRVERATAPVVVGPTLVGHVVRHLDALRAGEVLRVRLAVIDRLETIGFELRAVDARPGQTRIRVKPSSLLVALVVDPLHFTFETATARLVRLEGRVPPKLRVRGSWRDLDARVEYRFVAEAFR
jgi:hypothetical protein